MRIPLQILLVCAALAMGVFVSPAAKAECNLACQSEAITAGQDAARKTILAEIPDGALGQLMNVEMTLLVCDAKHKSAAVTKLRRAHSQQLVDQGMKDMVRSNPGGTEEQIGLRAASFTVVANSLETGYGVGIIATMHPLVTSSAVQRAKLCGDANRRADDLLFGDKAK